MLVEERMSHAELAPNTNCSNFISKSQWLPSSLDVNPMDYYVWGSVGDEDDRQIQGNAPYDMDSLPQGPINKL